ncbi:MAG: N-acetylmuramoyl-L-alanine amidase [Duncaniella sp.]|nr:N-acetylmuramoyl-L-alanine amidase [Duncaniella sp.]
MPVSRHISLIKRAVMIIMALACVIYFPATAEAKGKSAAAKKEYVVMIDPGHGAHDAGALGVNTTEKAINLAVGLKLAALIKAGMPDATVVMTRDDDTFVTLNDRAKMANRRHADVFISIHANSVDKKSPSRATIRGAAVYTFGLDRSNANLSVAMRENEVMKLEDNYSATYQGFDPSSTESYIMFDIVQHAAHERSVTLAHEVQKELVATAGRKNNGVKQAPFYVLVYTTMPSILVELDFICNPEMEKFMASDDGQNRLARAIYNGLRNYRGTGKSHPSASAKSEPSPEPAPSAAAPQASGEVHYRIQFLTSSRPLPASSPKLEGVDKPEYYIDGGVYKYTSGRYASPSEAQADLRRLREKHPEAFVVKMQGDNRVK